MLNVERKTFSYVGLPLLECLSGKAEHEVLDTDTRYNETVMTGLRTCEGVDLKYISDSFGAKYGRHLLSNAQKNISLGNLIVEDNRLRLTRKGIYTSDGITAELFV